MLLGKMGLKYEFIPYVCQGNENAYGAHAPAGPTYRLRRNKVQIKQDGVL